MIDIPRFIGEFGPHILHVQAKDMLVDREGLYERGVFSVGIGWQVPRLPGLGDVEWDRLFAALYRAGYDGDVIIEHEDRGFEKTDDLVKRGFLLVAGCASAVHQVTARTVVAGRLVLDEAIAGGRVVMEDGWIEAVELDPGLDDAARLFAPGFIDVHVHGWGGHDAMGDVSALDGMARALARRGVTAFLPTAVTAPLGEARTVRRPRPGHGGRSRPPMAPSRSASTWRALPV